MANITLDASLKETVKSLDLEKVPDKLHCAACHQFLFNAYKASCCDQFICETCFDASSTSCPICDHTPFNQDVCKPSKAVRGTAKAYLKMVEKTMAEDKAKAAPIPQEASTTILNGTTVTDAGTSTNGEPNKVENRQESSQDRESLKLDASDLPHPSVEVSDVVAVVKAAVDISQDAEADDAHARHNSAETDGGDDEVEIQVEPSQEEMESEEYKANLEAMAEYAEFEEPTIESKPKEVNGDSPKTTNENNFTNMMQNGFNGMDYNQMMQQMMGMAGFNSMMSMPMGGNPMSSGFLGGFGGPNGISGMNSMNMGMNFNPSQMFGAFNNLNNNMWQNNNPNAFPNGVGGDFGPSFGFNMHPSGNFHQQQFQNGDFQNGYYNRGYGRGRGRGRSGYGRGRGNFNQYSQNQPMNLANFQDASSAGNHNVQMQTKSQQEDVEVPVHEVAPDDDEFAPGGQEEVQEALGDDYDKTKDEGASEMHVSVTVSTAPICNQPSTDIETIPEPISRLIDTQMPTGQEQHEQKIGSNQDQHDHKPPSTGITNLIPEAYQDDLTDMMPPASAPLGPSAHYSGGRDFTNRPRGHGRFSSQGRGALPLLNSRIVSPIKSNSRDSTTPAIETKGIGVVGAPTGPRAMREPVVKPSPSRTSTGGGFQIMGRATMTTRDSQSNVSERARSQSPVNGHAFEHGDREVQNGADSSFSRRASRLDRRDSSRQDLNREEYQAPDRDREQDDDRDHDRDHRRQRSRRDNHEDSRSYDNSQSHSRAESIERKPSHRSREERNSYMASTKHGSSMSKKYESPQEYDDDYEMKDYEVATESRRETYESDSRNGHRRHHSSHKSGRHEDRERAKDRPRDRDRERENDREARDKERDKDKDRDRHHRERDRDKDKDRDRERERDRKRSRHDRDREDEYEQSNNNTPTNYANNHEDDEDTHHRSRRHKKSHRSSNLDSVVAELPGAVKVLNGTANSSRSQSHRSSEVPHTPAPTSKPSATAVEPEKDPHTLEREARNRERMLKEQQRREKAAAANDTNAGGSTSKRHRDRDRDKDRDRDRGDKERDRERGDKDRDRIHPSSSSSRRVGYKYEDEAERGMLENERAAARWR